MLLFEKIAARDFDAEVSAAGDAAVDAHDKAQEKKRAQEERARKQVRDRAEKAKREQLEIVTLPNGKKISLKEHPEFRDRLGSLRAVGGKGGLGEEFEGVFIDKPRNAAEAFHNGAQDWSHTPGARRFLIDAVKDHFDHKLELSQQRERNSWINRSKNRLLARHLNNNAWAEKRIGNMVNELVSHNKKVSAGMLGVAGLGGLGLLALTRGGNRPQIVLPAPPVASAPVPYNSVQYESDYYH